MTSLCMEAGMYSSREAYGYEYDTADSVGIACHFSSVLAEDSF